MTPTPTPLVVKQLAAQWQLSEPQYRCLLALDSAAIPELLKIDAMLHHLFAASPGLAALWMTSQNRALANHTPMEVVEQEGMAGVQRVVDLLCLAQEPDNSLE